MLIPLLLPLLIFSPLLHSMKDVSRLNMSTNAYLGELRTVQTFLKQKNNVLPQTLGPVNELARINRQFTHHRDELNKERTASILRLKNFHNIDDEIWTDGMEQLKTIKTEIKNCINTMLPDAPHDPIISGKNKLLFAMQLKKYGLNINKIYIETNDVFYDELPSFLYTELENPHKIRMKSPKIVLSSTRFNQLSPPQQEALLLKYAWIMGNISTISSVFISFIVMHTDKDYNFNTLQQTKEYRSFLNLEREKCAEIFPCLEDYRACRLMKKLRAVFCSYPRNLAQHKEHFHQLCILENLWKQRASLAISSQQ